MSDIAMLGLEKVQKKIQKIDFCVFSGRISCCYGQGASISIANTLYIAQTFFENLKNE
jgi:hypothetical protein